VDPTAELVYQAWLGDSCTREPATALASAAAVKPMVLTISPGGSAPLGGRVVDSAGRPIAGATVRIWRIGRGKDQRLADLEPIMAQDGRMAVRTDSEGMYLAPRRVSLPGEFFIDAAAPGRLANRSRAVVVADRNTKLPDVILRRVGWILGRVLDRQGQPVSRAHLMQGGDGPMPTSAVSDQQGRFRVSGVLEGPAILAARTAGFQTEPHLLTGGEETDAIVLTRTDEPAARVYKALPAPLSDAEETALSRRLLRPFGTRVLREGTEDDKRNLLMRTAEIDPDWTLEHLADGKFSNPADLDHVRSNVAGALLRINADEAAALIESISDPAQRGWVYAGSAHDLLKREPARARQYLDQAILSLKAAAPRQQLNAMVTIIETFADLGEPERARELLAAQRRRIDSLAPGKARGTVIFHDVVMPLARIDASAAIKEAEALKHESETDAIVRPGSFDFMMGKVGYLLADRSPQDAERLLRRCVASEDLTRGADRYVLAVCSRMAARDPARAKTLTSLTAHGEIELKAFALGLIAQSLAFTDRARALQFIGEAYTELEQLRSQGRVSQFASISTVAGGLLPIVEQIDGSRLPEFLARAICLRLAPDYSDHGGFIPEQNAQLAMMVARYDRGLAAHVIQPDMDRLGKFTTLALGSDPRTGRTLCSLTLIDPLKAAELIERLPEPPSLSVRGTRIGKYEILIDAAKLLSLHGEDRWRHVYDQHLHLWTPDQDVR
jgi:hypothetical protein